MTHYPFRDSTLAVESRVADLLSRLTLEEKAGQLSQYFYFAIGDLPDGVTAESLPPEQQAYLAQPKMVEAAVSGGGSGSVLFVKDGGTANRLQRLAVEETRLGIPLLFGFDVVHGLRTIFPVPIALAATWSPTIVEKAQVIAAREARAAGIHWTFAPMVDVARDPRWGRIVEGAGEDPELGSVLAAAQVRGFQGDLGLESILAGPKHLAGYGAARGGRDYDDAEVSDSELWNIYLPPFRAAVDAGAANVMSAYMDLNGVPASASRWLLTDVLREEFGFKGFVVSDADAVKSLETQHFAKDALDAAVRAIEAGLDLEMCMFEPAFQNLPEAVRSGKVNEGTIDDAVGRVLTAKFRLGLFEHPYVDEASALEVLTNPAHRDASRSTAEKSIVLLKNDDDALPLSGSSLEAIAVIGQLADSKRDTLGPWVFDHDLAETVTVLEGLRARAGAGIRVDYAPGVHIPDRLFPSMFDQGDATIMATPEDYDDDAELDRAVRTAAEADVAVVVIGQKQNQIGEGAATATLDFSGRQLEQLRRVSETGTPVIVVVMSGRPLDLRWAKEHAPAIVQAWYPGSRGGEAVASVLFGDVSPGGRLPFTWPRHVGQVPLVYNHYRTFQPENQDKRYFEEESTPLYPFGHGLSYSRFAYDNLRLDRSTISVGQSVTVTVDVANVGDREADEVLQLYIHQRYGTATRPVRELKGFERVTLSAGERRSVEFVLGPSQLRYWSAVTGGYVQDATTIDIWVGGSSSGQLAAELRVCGVEES